ncbi:MAG: flagellar hook capping FlgD N-terminal domain-containing protein [Elusimicrobiota bacterium]
MIDSLNGFTPSIPDAPNPGRELDKDAFLKLLTAQIQHQDPLNPTDQNEMFGTLSQMTQVEQITNLNSNVSSLLHTNQLNLIGKEVAALDDEGKAIQGIVQEIAFVEGDSFMLIDGKTVSIKNLLSVTIPK